MDLVTLSHFNKGGGPACGRGPLGRMIPVRSHVAIMKATPVEKEKLRRISHSKVRTDCLTCRYYSQSFPVGPLRLTLNLLHRSRHVKCDEERPVCMLCRKSGLACDYRQILDKRTRAFRAGKIYALDASHRTALNPREQSPRVLARQVDLTWRERY